MGCIGLTSHNIRNIAGVDKTDDEGCRTVNQYNYVEIEMKIYYLINAIRRRSALRPILLFRYC